MSDYVRAVWLELALNLSPGKYTMGFTKAERIFEGVFTVDREFCFEKTVAFTPTDVFSPTTGIYIAARGRSPLELYLIGLHEAGHFLHGHISRPGDPQAEAEAWTHVFSMMENALGRQSAVDILEAYHTRKLHGHPEIRNWAIRLLKSPNSKYRIVGAQILNEISTVQTVLVEPSGRIVGEKESARPIRIR